MVLLNCFLCSVSSESNMKVKVLRPKRQKFVVLFWKKEIIVIKYYLFILDRADYFF